MCIIAVLFIVTHSQQHHHLQEEENYKKKLCFELHKISVKLLLLHDATKNYRTEHYVTSELFVILNKQLAANFTCFG